MPGVSQKRLVDKSMCNLVSNSEALSSRGMLCIHSVTYPDSCRTNTPSGPSRTYWMSVIPISRARANSPTGAWASAPTLSSSRRAAFRMASLSAAETLGRLPAAFTFIDQPKSSERPQCQHFPVERIDPLQSGQGSLLRGGDQPLPRRATTSGSMPSRRAVSSGASPFWRPSLSTSRQKLHPSLLPPSTVLAA